MRYFLDSEFIEDGVTIDLISIGIVSEDGRTYYAQNLGCKFSLASDWVWRHVFPHLQHFDMRGTRACVGMPRSDSLTNAKQSKCGAECFWRERYEIREEVRAFCDPEKHGKPEFWGYYCDYDWVGLCQLFGPMMALPKGWPMFCMDIQQWSVQKAAMLPKSEKDIHHALADAEQIQEWFHFLNKP